MKEQIRLGLPPPKLIVRRMEIAGSRKPESRSHTEFHLSSLFTIAETRTSFEQQEVPNTKHIADRVMSFIMINEVGISNRYDIYFVIDVCERKYRYGFRWRSTSTGLFNN
jgi:hypothetical protein